MINYTTAIELKKVGFPQDYDERKMAVNSDNTAYAFPPTLEELIEACGGQDQDRFMLYQKDGQWEATYRGSDRFAGSHLWTNGTGPTPTEAVAKLWLVLNTKTV